MELNKDNYYSQEMNTKYMSYSQFKTFSECPARAIAELNGTYKREETDALLVGSYVDAYLDGELERFKNEHPDIFTLKGELKAPFKLAETIIETINNDAVLKNYLSGGRQEILTCKINGVEFKVKIDSLHDDFIIDGKVLKDCNEAWINGEKKSFIYSYRYDLQGAIYRLAVLQKLHKKLPFGLAVVTKEKTPDKRLIKISDTVLNDALQEVITNAPVYDAMKKGEEKVYGCGVCDYCKSIKKLKENDWEEI